jgi:hypothetical protein
VYAEAVTTTIETGGNQLSAALDLRLMNSIGSQMMLPMSENMTHPAL